jgi:cytoskeleton protein RodZ
MAPAEERRSDETSVGSDPPSAALGTVGSDLRATREQKEIELRQVSDDTRISMRHLMNLEEGNYRDLPGGMYNRAFLRTYCQYLGLEADSFLERFEIECPPPGERIPKSKARIQQAPLSQPVHIPPVLVWTLMLLASVVGLYFSRGWIREVFSPYFSRPPAVPIAAKTPEPAAPAMPKATEPDSALATVPLPPGEMPMEGAANAGGLNPATPPTTQAEPAAIPEGTIRLEFAGIAPCWMSLTGDKKTLFNGIVQPGETPAFDAKESFEIVLGNAGGLTLKINGKPAKPLGKPGEVVKLTIDNQTLQDLIEK